MAPGSKGLQLAPGSAGLRLKSGSRILQAFSVPDKKWLQELPRRSFEAFLASGSKGVPGGFQEVVLQAFLVLGPKSGSRSFPGGCFEAFLAPSSKVPSGGLQEDVLKHFWRQV